MLVHTVNSGHLSCSIFPLYYSVLIPFSIRIYSVICPLTGIHNIQMSSFLYAMSSYIWRILKHIHYVSKCRLYYTQCRHTYRVFRYINTMFLNVVFTIRNVVIHMVYSNTYTLRFHLFYIILFYTPCL